MSRSTQSSFSWYSGSVSKSHPIGAKSNASALSAPELGGGAGGSALQPALEGQDIVLPVATVPPQGPDGHQPAGRFEAAQLAEVDPEEFGSFAGPQYRHAIVHGL